MLHALWIQSPSTYPWKSYDERVVWATTHVWTPLISLFSYVWDWTSFGILEFVLNWIVLLWIRSLRRGISPRELNIGTLKANQIQMKKTVQRWGEVASEEVTKLTLTDRPLVWHTIVEAIEEKQNNRKNCLLSLNALVSRWIAEILHCWHLTYCI